MSERSVDFVLVTHTKWSEAPRIRHQVAGLLLDAGHRVAFLERPRGPLTARQPPRPGGRAGLTVVPRRELLHRQLRLSSLIDRANARFVVRDLRSIRDELRLQEGVRVINFAADYWFLREVFPQSRVTTIVHDDFEALCRLPYTAHVTAALRRTCASSDDVLAVSTPLCRRLAEWCRPELFLPWAVTPYRSPGTVAGRDTLLFWGFIDRSLDTDFISRLSSHLARTRPGWRIALVGPTASRRRSRVLAPLAGLRNITIHDATPLDDLPLDRCLAAILPYRPTPIVNAVTLANKSMQLLARGLPMLICAMPAFLQEPFVFRMDGEAGIEGALRGCEFRFESLQPAIRAFLDENSPASRLRQLGVRSAADALPPAAGAHQAQ